MSDYVNISARCAQLGLNLRDVNDRVGEGYWTRLNNVQSSQEGAIQLREGATTFVETLLGTPHSVRRLDPVTLVIGVGNMLFRNSDVYLDPVTAAIFTGFSGNPLSFVPFKAPDSDDPWMFIGDSATLRKAAADGRLYQWGGEPPTTVATAVAGGPGLLNSSVAGAIAYRWRYIYRSSDSGARTNPSPEMPIGVSLTSQQAFVTVEGTTDPQFDTIELYRTGGVNTDGTYRFVASATNTPGPVVITDNIADSAAAVAEPLLLTRFRPFQSVVAGVQVTVPLPYIWPFMNFILGAGDVNRPGYLYWTNPGEPDTADVVNNVQITPQSEPIIAGFTYEGRPYVFTRDNLYAIDYGVGITTFRGFKTSCGRGLAAPRAFAIDGPMIYFLSGDGIYATDGQSPAVSLTEETLRPIFNGLQAYNYIPIDFNATNALRLWWAGQQLYFSYQDLGGTQRMLVYDAPYKRWRGFTTLLNTLAPGVVYEDENQAKQRVLLTLGGAGLAELTQAARTDAGIDIVANARTGALDLGKPATLKEFGNLIVDANPAGDEIDVAVFFNEEQEVGPTFTLTGTGRQKFPISLLNTYAYDISVDFSWRTAANLASQSIYQFEILAHLDEERITHWEYPATSHGFSGWQQLRDGYIALNSTGAVTMTVEIDGGTAAGGSTDTYTIPSTAGLRLKRYVRFRPRKGKVFRYSLDGGPFLLYGDDCELRHKPWNTNLGYALISPFRKVA